MRGEWSPEELVESWTLLGDEWKRVGDKSGATRLGFAVLLKFFELEARFPRAASDVPPGAVAYVAEQVGVPAARFADYWQAARAVKRHRVEIRGVFGFREATRGRGDVDGVAGRGGVPRRARRRRPRAVSGAAD